MSNDLDKVIEMIEEKITRITSFIGELSNSDYLSGGRNELSALLYELEQMEKNDYLPPKMKKWNELTYCEKLACISLYPDEDISDEKEHIKLEYYMVHGFTKAALKDKDGDIRLEYYMVHGFTEEALKDKASYIRLAAYRELGFTKAALEDESRGVRFGYYRKHGFTKEALKDEYWEIREEAKIYFKIKGELENEEME